MTRTQWISEAAAYEARCQSEAAWVEAFTEGRPFSWLAERPQ